MKKIFFMALAAIALGACNSEPKFKVEGEVSGADGKMLYLEASALEGIVPLDSVKLKGDGSFHFKQVRPVSPEFYRLRVPLVYRYRIFAEHPFSGARHLIPILPLPIRSKVLRTARR